MKCASLYDQLEMQLILYFSRTIVSENIPTLLAGLKKKKKYHGGMSAIMSFVVSFVLF